MSTIKRNEPLVSIILPVFNNGDFLMLAVESILNQSYQNWELIVIDDGSIDDACKSVELIYDSRIRLFKNSANQGLAVRLNEGVLASKGRYIARMDADDVSFPTRIEEQVRYLEDHPEIDLVGARAVVFRLGKGILGLLPFAAEHADLVARPWRNIPLPHPTWMGKRTWFIQNPYRIPETKRSEDQELLLRTYRTSRFSCLSTVLLGYQQRPFNLKRTLLARKELGLTQLRYFLRQRSYRYAAFSLMTTFLKVIVDIFASIPGFDKLFFFRMSSPVPHSAVYTLNLCLNNQSILLYSRTN